MSTDTYQERVELGYSDGSRAIVEVIGAEEFSVPETEEHIALSERLMTGWLNGEQVWDVEAVAWSIGKAELVDFGLFPNRTGKLVRLTDRVGGWSVRIATAKDESVDYAWVVVGWHDESVVPMVQLRDRFGRPSFDTIDRKDPNTGEVVGTIGVPRQTPRYGRNGQPYVQRKFSPVMWKRFTLGGTYTLETVQEWARDLADRMIAAWEEHTGPADDGADEARVARAADGALLERSDPDAPNPFEELC